MIQLRVRLVNDDGTVGISSRVLDARQITYTPVLNSPATVAFTVPRSTFTPVQMPFVVRIEYSVDGGRFQPVPEHELFIVEGDRDDSKDPAGYVSYTGVGYVSWLLAGAYVGTGPWEKDGARRINGDGSYKAHAGHIMSYFIDESKGRGWLTHLTRTFNATNDSAGTPWGHDQLEEIGWRLETFYTQVLDQLTGQGMCDWSTQGGALSLYRAGTRGVDRSESVSIGGPEFDRVPVTTDVSGWFTHVLGLSEAGRVHASDPALESRFGRRSSVMTLSGVTDTATAQRLANAALDDGVVVKREEAYTWTPGVGGVQPFKDFGLGDLVTAHARGGKRSRRVIGMVLRQSDGPAEVQVRVGEKLSSLAAKNQRLLQQLTVGGVVGGSGDAFPSGPQPPNAVPDRPNGLILTGNEGWWGDDGTAHAAVSLAWSPVTSTVDGAEIDIANYEVWSRHPAGGLALDTVTNGTSVTIEGWTPGEDRLVVVYAISVRGARSQPSLELAVTPQFPVAVTPKAPTGLAVVSNTGAYTDAGPVATVVLDWVAVTESTDDEPLTVNEYEVWADGAPLTRVAGTSVTVSLPSNVGREYRVGAISVQGARGDLSAPISVTGAAPTVAARAPSEPILSTGNSVVVARWDGTYTSPAQGEYVVRFEARLAGDTTWVAQGAALSIAGSTIIRLGVPGDTVEVRLVAFDPLGRFAGASTVASVEVEGIDGADILAGTIEGNRIIAGTISADELVPNIGDTLNIAANESIVLMAGRMDETDNAVADAQQTADAALTEAENAEQAAALAAADAAAADGKALVAQTMAQDAQDQLTSHQAVFRVIPTGAEVASIDGSNLVRITPDGVQIVQGGTAASTWDAGRLIVNEAIVNRAQIGAHSFERYSAGRTIIRPI